MNQILRDKKENLVYLAIWLILLAVPAVSMYVRGTRIPELPFNWSELIHIWQMFLVFFAIFVIHNFLIAPLLIYKQRKALYFTAIGCLLAAFVVMQCSTRPDHRPRDKQEVAGHQHDKQEVADRPHNQQEVGRPHDQPDTNRRPPRKHGVMGPVVFGPSEVINSVFLMLLLGMNLGVKLYFKNERDRKMMLALKDQNLEHQLAYLKYQINPHFFMNTLNNIHALVDIDPEKAKESIVVLSKMMRHILYEGDFETVSLQSEIAFINHYVTLMRMRYTDRVSIQLDITPTDTKGDIPPLLLITFVENAFKHGISYERESFIELHLSTTDDQIRFLCRNSKASSPNPEKGGIGLENVRKRLSLIYHDQYTLDINDTDDEYTVSLNIPKTIKPIQPS